VKKKIKTKNSYFIELPVISEKNRGNLCFGEIKKQIPFDIKRFYYIFDVPPKTNRAQHAHKTTKQVLFCINALVRIKLDDGVNKDEIILSKPNEGIFLGEMLWTEVTNFQRDTILLVLASDFYKENDYIRDYKIFKEYFKK